MVSHNLAIQYLICPVTSQNHVIEGSCNFLNESSSWFVNTMPSLLIIDIVVAEI